MRIYFWGILILIVTACSTDNNPLDFEPQTSEPDTETPDSDSDTDSDNEDTETDPDSEVGTQDPNTNSGRIPCTGGMAGDFPCEGYDLMSRVLLSEMDAEAGNDSWGWTDPATGKEYALMGLDNGTAFIDITQPEQPIYLGKLLTRTENSPWRDIKVYKNHAFVVSEAGNHGLQVFDLTRLREVSSPLAFKADAELTSFGSAHNIVINESTGFAYIVGADGFDGGPIFINIQDPKNPTNAGGFAGDSYTHDAQVVTYTGPDADYVGNEIFIGSNEDTVTLVDVTDKDNPVLISKIAYSNIGYTHQGWLTEDHRYFIGNDEVDEINFGFNTRSLIFDFQDLDNPELINIYSGPTQAIDHNYYIKGNTLFLSNYTAGLRVVDIQAIASGNLTEIGHFDSYPQNDITGFSGAWSNYPYFESGNILISDINGGLMVIKKSGT